MTSPIVAFVRITKHPAISNSAVTLPSGLQVGTLAVVNCVGNVFDINTGRAIAGTRREDRR